MGRVSIVPTAWNRPRIWPNDKGDTTRLAHITLWMRFSPSRLSPYGFILGSPAGSVFVGCEMAGGSEDGKESSRDLSSSLSISSWLLCALCRFPPSLRCKSRSPLRGLVAPPRFAAMAVYSVALVAEELASAGRTIAIALSGIVPGLLRRGPLGVRSARVLRAAAGTATRRGDGTKEAMEGRRWLRPQDFNCIPKASTFSPAGSPGFKEVRPHEKTRPSGRVRRCENRNRPMNKKLTATAPSVRCLA
jgi:hypothetical protein